MPFKVLENPAPKENLVHNMEHGGVVIWYNTDDQDVIKQLADTINDEIDRRKLVVMSQVHGDGAEHDRRDLLDASGQVPASATSTRSAWSDFIEANSKRFNPEGF